MFASRDDDEDLYAIAGAEIRTAQERPGLWARAFSESNGDPGRAQATYIRERVRQLREERAARIIDVKVRPAQSPAPAKPPPPPKPSPLEDYSGVQVLIGIFALLVAGVVVLTRCAG
jgi:hypothetical protein